MQVSLILPVKYFNFRLKESLESTFMCLKSNMELIVVEDEADTEALELLDAFHRVHPEMVRIKNKGKGLVDALHSGISVAKGKYIARMDSDDICLNNRFEKQMNFLDENQAVGLVSCQVHYGGNTTENPGFARFVDYLNTLNTHEKMFAKRYAEVIVVHPSVMFRKALLAIATYRKTNDLGQEIPEDFDLFLRWLNAGVHFAKLDEVLLEWTDSPNRLSRTHRAYAASAFRISAAEHFLKPPNKAIWIWGFGNSVQQKIRPFVSRGLTVSGYIDVKERKTQDNTQVITIHEVPKLKNKALILVFVGDLTGKNLIQSFLDTHAFIENEDYLWMV